MNVEGAVRRGSKQLARQKQPVGGDDQRIGAQRAPVRCPAGSSASGGCASPMPRAWARRFTGLGNRTQPAAGGPVGLGQGQNDLMACRQERASARSANSRRAGEDEAQE